MRRYIVLLLITGIVWAQTDFDKLVLKNGTTYLGEYEKIEVDRVYFKPQNVFASQPISKNTLALEKYQKLSTEEKGIYDANLYNLNKWALYGPMSTILFGGCVLLKDYFNKKQVLKKDMIRLESPIFLGGSLAASSTIPYFVLNKKFYFPKSILNITDSEKEIYKQAYSKKLKKRKIKYAAVGTIVTGVAVSLMVGQINSGFNMSGGGGGGKGFTGFGP
jgi:hypothetical protein